MLGTANVDSVVGLLEKFGDRVTPELDVAAAFDRVAASDRISDYAVDMSFGEAFDYLVHVRRGEQGAARYDGLLLRYFVTGKKSSRTLTAVAG